MGQVGTDDDASGRPDSNDTNITSYKITISILFGLLGFIVNFYPVDFVFYGTYKMSFLLGLVFPMLITLAWGWRYGLLSALAGGCQTMWILWMPGSGYGPFVSVPPFTLWIVWHGWFLRTRYSIYLGELIFRIFNTALLYTIFRWAFTLNVPPANTYMPLAVAHSIVFKEAVNGLLIIFIAQGLLYGDPVRQFFKLPKSTADPRLYYTYMSAVILGGILICSFTGERYIWGLWGPEFQYAARILGSVLLLMLGILCTYRVANVFAKRKTEELIHAEEVLRESEKKLSQIIDGSSIPTFVIDGGHTVTHWNIACENLTGIPASEIVGTSRHWSALYPAERPLMADLIVDELSEEEIAGYYGDEYQRSALIEGGCEAEKFFRHLGGGGKWIFFTAAPLRNPEGEIVGAIEALQDVTARNLAEQALRKSEEEYHLLADNSIDCIWRMNMNFEFTYANPAILQILGFTPEEWIGSSLSGHCSPAALEFMSGLVEELKKGPELTGGTFETQLFHKNGETVPVEMTARILLDEDGNPVGFQGATRDITERKIAEAKLNRTLVDLKRSNTDLEQFAYVASHDLQEPLRMVSGYMQLMKRRYEGKLDSDADDFIGFAVDGANRMQTLINDLLTYSRVGTRGKPLTPTDCETLLAQTISNLKVPIDDSGAVVTHDPLPTVMADGSQLAHVFQNLIGNAIKFKSEEPPRIHIAAEQKGDEWFFSVADNGVGIEPEFFDRIFVIFQRLHGRDEYTGTGIGLAVCKKIVDRHGGRMWVESELGRGSTFYFTIPTNGEGQGVHGASS